MRTFEKHDFQLPGYKLIAHRPVSANPLDEYLSYVLAVSKIADKMEYVVWLYNHQDKGCSGGDYIKEADKALDRFLTRK